MENYKHILNDQLDELVLLLKKSDRNLNKYDELPHKIVKTSKSNGTKQLMVKQEGEHKYKYLKNNKKNLQYQK